MRGAFTGLPTLVERDQCRDCNVAPLKKSEKRKPVVLPEHAAHAAALAHRANAYLSLLSRGDSASIAQAASAHPELHRDLSAWFAQSPEQRREDLKYAKSATELVTLSNVFASGSLIPSWHPRRSTKNAISMVWTTSPRLRTGCGDSRDPFDRCARAEAARAGRKREPRDALTALHNAGWCEDPGGTSPLLPKEHYYSGNLWPKYDRARERAQAGDAVAAVQASQLLATIKPLDLAEINVEPRLGWLPQKVIEAWVNEVDPISRWVCARTRGRVSDALGSSVSRPRASL